MGNIVRGDSRGHIVGMQYVFSEEILSHSGEDGYDQIHLKPGGEWKHVLFTPGSCEFREQDKVDGNGHIFEMDMQFEVPGRGIELRDICGRPVCVVMQYYNGDAIVVGGRDKKLRLTRKFVSDRVNSSVVGFKYSDRDGSRVLVIE